MSFVVKQKDGTEVTLTENQLLNILMSKVLETNEDKLQEFISVTTSFATSSSEELVKVPIQEIINLSFNLGYYFRIFKTKNTVTYIKDENV